MNLTNEDKQLLAELCEQSSVSKEKVLRLLETIQEYECKDRRTGIYDELREILKTTFEPRKHAI
jgi:DNA-binding IclR family transcriptional regulator